MNKTHKIFRVSKIQTNHPISTRKQELMQVNKKRNCRLVDFAVPVDHWEKIKESEKINEYLDFARES